MSKYNVAIIGAGPAGYVSAIRAAQLGLKTAIIDKQWLGGVCLNVGCIPSKALLRNAEIAHILRKRGKDFGFSFENLKLDYSQAVKRSRQASDRLTRGVGFLMKKNNIDVFMGTAEIASKNTIQISKQSGELTTLETDNIVIATGASTIIPKTWHVDGEYIITYLEAILQEKLPKSVVIIGSGAIGVEFATVWNSYGSEVTIVEMLPHIVPLEDEEISIELEKSFKRRKINVLTAHKVEKVIRTENGVEVSVSSAEGVKQLKAEQALIAIGFKPNTAGIGLENLGVKLTNRGAIQINDRMETNIPNIFAIGDVTAKLMLAHVGSAQGIICAENIAGADTVTLDYTMIPRATYCAPQIASFGLTEKAALEQGFEIQIGRFPFLANGKALGLGDYSGWVKIIINKKYGEILGAHLIGPEVTELLPELTIAQMTELTISEIARNVHAHPTLSEAIMEAAHAAEGHPINI
ncbi:MAG TPA: dihydrolipoyl dehydrogenase [Anaerolineae bacterium]|nr:dihydrolipoyl dehydrogenase [Anaerolineae bacterium]